MTWALGLTGITLLVLVVLSVGLFLMLALAYGSATALVPAAGIASPDARRFRWAFLLASAVAVVGAVVGAAVVARLADATPSRRWPPVLQGLIAAGVAAFASVVVLLLGLGIDPVDFLAAW